MRQSFETVQCFWQWCIRVYAGIILPEVEVEEGEVHAILLPHRKEKSIHSHK